MDEFKKKKGCVSESTLYTIHLNLF